MNKSHFEMFAAYNTWANDRLYAAAALLSVDELNQSTGAFFGSLLATLNHILVADRVWMSRFTGTGEAPKSLDAILYAAFEPLALARQAEDRRISDWVETLDAARIEERFTYSPISSPEVITQRLGPALSHMFNHQTHHRGQAHTILTTLGKPAVVMDLVYFLRSDGKAWL